MSRINRVSQSAQVRQIRAAASITVSALIAIILAYTFALLVGSRSAHQIPAELESGTASQSYCKAELRSLGYDNGTLDQEQQSNKAKVTEYANLCQQVRMARAAEEATHYAWWQLIVGVTGLVLLGLATWFAGRAAWHAKRAADSGGEITFVTKDSAERQLRAYIDVRAGRVTAFHWGMKPKAEIKFLNSGQTPARNLTARLIIRIDPLPDAFKIWLSGVPGSSKADLGAHVPTGMSVEYSETLSQEEFEGIKAGTHGLFVGGVIRYYDVFGKRHFTVFRLTPDLREIDLHGTTLIACQRGNSSN